MYLRKEVLMLKKEDYSMIKALVEHGVYQKDIAQKLYVHPKTISRALKRGSTPGKRRKAKIGKLDAYKPTIDRLLSDDVWNAVVILREIQAEGYDGEISL
jgi:IS30 family transposase